MRLAHNEIPGFVKNLFFSNPDLADDALELNNLELDDDLHQYNIKCSRLLLLFLSFYLYPPEKFALASLVPASAEDRALLFSDAYSLEHLNESLKTSIAAISLQIQNEGKITNPEDAEEKTGESTSVSETEETPLLRLGKAFSVFYIAWRWCTIQRIHFACLSELNFPETYEKMHALCLASHSEQTLPHKKCPYYILDSLQNSYSAESLVNFASANILATDTLEPRAIVDRSQRKHYVNVQINFAEGPPAFSFHTSHTPLLYTLMAKAGVESTDINMTPVNGGYGASAGAGAGAGASVEETKESVRFALDSKKIPDSMGKLHTHRRISPEEEVEAGEEKEKTTDTSSASCGCFSFLKRR